LRRLIFIGLCGAMLAGTSSCRREDWSSEAIAASKQIGDEILNAIERYCDATGHVPDSLELLVPDYLEAVKPPVAGRRKWRYAAKGDDCCLWFGRGDYDYPNYGIWLSSRSHLGWTYDH